MNYTLYGSQTSPFVRRIRMLLNDLRYDFKELSIFEATDGAKLKKINPINQVPVFTDGDQVIWDSRQIFNYLNLNHKIQNMDWNDENLLTAIEGAMNSAVSLILMKRSGMDTEGNFMFVNRQRERIESVLDYLKPYIQNEAIKEWNFQSMSLYSFLDWGVFRGIFSLENRPECQKFLDSHAEREIVKETAIPKA